MNFNNGTAFSVFFNSVKTNLCRWWLKMGKSDIYRHLASLGRSSILKIKLIPCQKYHEFALSWLFLFFDHVGPYNVRNYLLCKMKYVKPLWCEPFIIFKLFHNITLSFHSINRFFLSFFVLSYFTLAMKSRLFTHASRCSRRR